MSGHPQNTVQVTSGVHFALRVFCTSLIILVALRPLQTGACRKQPSTPSTGRDIPRLTSAQKEQIQTARENGVISELRACRDATYTNQIPIVTNFTDEQTSYAMDVYGTFFTQHSFQNVENRIWEEGQNSTECPETVPIEQFQRKRRTATGSLRRVCGVTSLPATLVTAYNVDGNPVQIVHLADNLQGVIRSQCADTTSDHAVTSLSADTVYCSITTRVVPMLAIRLDEDADVDHYTIEWIQVETCSSLFDALS